MRYRTGKIMHHPALILIMKGGVRVQAIVNYSPNWGRRLAEREDRNG